MSWSGLLYGEVFEGPVDFHLRENSILIESCIKDLFDNLSRTIHTISNSKYIVLRYFASFVYRAMLTFDCYGADKRSHGFRLSNEGAYAKIRIYRESYKGTESSFL
ncbi:hypothetical protein TSUD_342700 [Trifolium subterraneum]|nr:hypothetical protein TSUD_342700 [Trifolium subterraneum]